MMKVAIQNWILHLRSVGRSLVVHKQITKSFKLVHISDGMYVFTFNKRV